MDKIKGVLGEFIRDLRRVFVVIMIFVGTAFIFILFSLGLTEFTEPPHKCEIISDEPILPDLIIKVLREGNDTTYIYRK